jgi:hypothetical protein
LFLHSDFAKLNGFVMSTWTNDIAVGINQDLLGVPAHRIDNASKIGPGTVLASPVQEYGSNGGANGGANAARLGAGLSSNMALMTVEECGGEPEDQKWVFGAPAAGFISNNATQSCINIARDVSNPGDPRFVHLVYDPCDSKGSRGNATAGERWTLSANGQVRRTALFVHFLYINGHFAKAGLGQT